MKKGIKMILKNNSSIKELLNILSALGFFLGVMMLGVEPIPECNENPIIPIWCVWGIGLLLIVICCLINRKEMFGDE